MTKFAICAGSEGSIWQLDTDNPSQLPFVLYKMKPYNSYINSIALTADQQFELVCGGFQSQIRRTQDMNTDLPVYSFPASEPSSESSNLIVHVRLRTIAGEERVYFSARDRTPEGTFNFTIYYLNNGIATVYTKIDPHQVTVPNPCSPSEEFPFYQGDFEFGEADSLYLSTGHLANRARIYLIAGAGPDAVTGTVQPIYEGDGPIYGLCYRSPQTLYFLRSNAVCKLYLGTMSEGPPEGTMTLPPYTATSDLAEIGNGFPHPFYLPLLSGVHRSLAAGAELMLWAATHTLGHGRPKPYPGLGGQYQRPTGM